MHDLLADLPAPRDDEPSSLRQDILDELSDHLACALHRELVKSGDSQIAEARVLDRFGDPRRIAVQLWFQAMWSRIMLQRVSMGLQGLLAVGVLLVAFLLFRVYDFQYRMVDEWQTLKNQSVSNQAMLMQVLNRLPAPPPVFEAGSGGEGAMGGMGAAADPSMMMSGAMGAGAMPGGEGVLPESYGSADSQASQNLVIQVRLEGAEVAKGYFLEVQDENGQGIPAELVNNPFGGEVMGTAFAPAGGMPSGYPGPAPSGVTFTGDGRYIRMWIDQPRPPGIVYSNVAPGRYTALLEFPDGRSGKQRFAVLPKEKKTLTITAPPPVEASLVTIECPKLPPIDPSLDIQAGVTITRPAKKLGGTDWTVKDEPSWEAWFDPTTGLVQSLQSPAGRSPRGGAPRQLLKFEDGEPADTRFVSLKSGEYQLTWMFRLQKPRTIILTDSGQPIASPGRISAGWPKITATTTRIAEPGTSKWILKLDELDEEVWNQIRQRAASFQPQQQGATEEPAPANP